MGKESLSASYYNNFDLHISARADGKYDICARSSEGECREQIEFPFDNQMIEIYKTKLELAIAKSSVRSRRIHTPDEQHVKDFGQALFKSIFADSLGRRFYAAREKSVRESGGLRIRLHIECPKLAALPWEYLFDPDQNEFVCLSTQTPIVRYPDIPQPIMPIHVSPPLRVLFMTANPRNAEYQIKSFEEKERIREALKVLKNEGLVETKWVGGETARHLHNEMREMNYSWNIFHFIGHGKFDPNLGEGALCLCDEEGWSDDLEARNLALLLGPQNLSLGLVFLNCCEGAKGSDKDVFSSMAATLTRRNIPAVVAMQYEISDTAAIEFSRTFYESIVKRRPIDMALTDARVAVCLHKKKSLEWGIPALYMHSTDGAIFSIPEQVYQQNKSLKGQISIADSQFLPLNDKKTKTEEDKKAFRTSLAEILTKPIPTKKKDSWRDDLSEMETQAELRDWLYGLESLEELEEKDLKNVIAVSEGLLVEDPTNKQIRLKLAKALDRLGVIYKKRKQWSEAVGCCSRAIEEAPLTPDYHYHRAICHMRIGNLEPSLKDFDTAIDIDTKNSEYYWGRGLLYGNAALSKLRWASHEKAIEDFNKAIALEPLAHYYRSRSTAFGKLGKYELAYNDIKTALELNPENTVYKSEFESLRKQISAEIA
jgi:tetratricopeptide (TPR) repeat protein